MNLARHLQTGLKTALWLLLTLLAWVARSTDRLTHHLIQGGLDLVTDFIAETTWHARGLAFLILLALASLPGWAGPAMVPIMISALWFAYVGQAWNVAAGFSHQVSLGHTLFIGLGAYAGAGVLLSGHFTLWPGLTLALLAAAFVGAVAGALVGALCFRTGGSGVLFALTVLVLAELARLIATASSAKPATLSPALLPPGGEVTFYYFILAMTLLALVVCRVALRSSMGYRWCAVREDPEAAAAVGINIQRTRISALTVSAALAAPAGVFQACHAHALNPDQLFSLAHALELVVGPVLGGLGTLIGPLLGALMVVPAETILATAFSHAGHNGTALSLFCSGLVVAAVMVIQPKGLWPWCARQFRLVTSIPRGDQP